MRINIKIINFFILMIFCSFIQKGIKISEQKRLIKKKRIYSYRINVNDSKSFSYIPVKGDQSIGPDGIAIVGNYVFIADPDHSNIKKINITNGEICNVSMKIYQRNFLYDISYFNGFIYLIPPGTNKITRVDTNFVNHMEISLPKRLAPFPYLIVQKDSFFVEVDQKFKTDKNDVLKEFLAFDKSMEFSLVNKTIPFTIYNSLKNKGRVYNVKGENGIFFLKNDFGEYELDSKIPIVQSYDTSNIDFTEDCITFYSFDKDFTKLILTVYSY